MTRKITIYQALKRTGLLKDKKEIVSAVSAGRVTVDGIVTKTVQFQFVPGKRTVCLDGKPLHFFEKKYIVLNKPQGYSCQKNDSFPYVVDLLNLSQDVKNTMFPVGRLDIPTTGLLIITNDGAFASTLMEPERKVPKIYKVLLKDRITDEQLRKLQGGITITVSGKQYTTLPSKAEQAETGGEHVLLLEITEGKKRQIRKMVKEAGNTVVALARVAIGRLVLECEEGTWKEYTEAEIKKEIFG